MRHRTLASILLLAAALPAVAQSQPSLARGADDLWGRAVALYAEYGSLLPGRMIISFEQYNGRGNLVSTDQSEIEIWRDESDEIQSRIVSATRDGEDVTQERREDPSSGASPFGGAGGGSDDDGNGFAGLQLSPFDPAEQANVTVTGIGRETTINGIAAKPYEFVHETGENTRNRGVAWIATVNGDPVLLELTIDPLPSLVSEFLMRQEYERDDEGRWIVRRLEFSGAGSILFIRRRIESRLVFSDYFPSE